MNIGNDLYHVLFEFADDAILLMERGRIIEGNASARILFRRSQEEMAGQTLLHLSSPTQPNGQDSAQLIREKIVNALSGKWQQFEWRYQLPDGTTFDAQVALRQIPVGENMLFQATMHDIVERKEIEETARDIPERRKSEREIQKALERRDRQIQISTEIAQEIAAAPALDELYRRAVTLIKERFGYYHVQIFRHDPWQNAMVMVEGYGSAGAKMKAAGHKLPYDQGIVGTTASSGKPVLASDRSHDPDWVSHPDLPETKGELAVPIKLQDQVLGVLDVHSDAAGAPGEEDQVVLLGLAGQIAHAIEGTRAKLLLKKRVKELDCLNDIGHKIVENPPLPELLQWVTERIPTTMQYPGLCVTAIEFEDQLYGVPEAVTSPHQIAQSLRIGGEPVGKLFIAYTEKHDFLDEESALMGNIIRRVSSFIETRAALDQASIFRQFVQAAGQGFGMGTLDGQVLYLNPALAQIVGETNVKEAVGKPFLSYYPQEFQERLQTEVLPTVMKEGRWTGELALISAEGKVTPTLESFFLIRDEEGNPRYLADISTDIAERKQAQIEMENTLRELEGLTRTMSHEGWQSFRQVMGKTAPGYLYDQLSVRPATIDELGAVRTEGAPADRPVTLVPVIVQGEPIGMIGIHDDQDHPLSAEDHALLEALSSEVADALERARLFEQTQSARTQAEALYQASTTLNAVQGHDDVLAALCQHTLLDQAQDATVNLFDRPWTDEQTPEWIDMVAHRGESPPEIARSRSSMASFAWVIQLLNSNTPTLLEDVTTDPRLDERSRANFVQALDVKSAIFIPLVVGGQWIGNIHALYQQQTEFPEEKVRSIVALAGQAAVAIQSLRQLEEIEARAGREHALRQVSETIGTAENLIESLPAVAQHLRALVPLDRLTVATYTAGDPECFISCVDVQMDDSHTYSARLTQIGAALPVKGSATGWVITHGELRMDQDIRHEMLFAEDKQLIADGLISRLILPLRIGEQIVGTLNVSGTQPDAFSQEHLPILLQVAGQIALTLERARLLEETRAALAQAEAVYKRYLSQEWQNYLSSSNRAWGYQDSPTKLVAVEDVWTPEIERAIDEGRTVTWQETGDDERSSRSALALPIRLGGQTIGVLDFYQEGQTREWTDDEKALVEALADQIALALDNARLIEQTERRAYREQLTGELASKIHGAGDVRSILAVAAEELGQALGVSRALIRLTPSQDEPPSSPQPDLVNPTGGNRADQERE